MSATEHFFNLMNAPITRNDSNVIKKVSIEVEGTDPCVLVADYPNDTLRVVPASSYNPSLGELIQADYEDSPTQLLWVATPSLGFVHNVNTVISVMAIDGGFLVCLHKGIIHYKDASTDTLVEFNVSYGGIYRDTVREVTRDNIPSLRFEGVDMDSLRTITYKLADHSANMQHFSSSTSLINRVLLDNGFHAHQQYLAEQEELRKQEEEKRLKREKEVLRMEKLRKLEEEQQRQDALIFQSALSNLVRSTQRPI